MIFHCYFLVKEPKYHQQIDTNIKFLKDLKVYI